MFQSIKLVFFAYILTLLGSNTIVIVLAGPGNRRHFPLLLDDEYNTGKRIQRPAECILGKQVHEIGSTWFPDLGPPLGVMYCMKCECIRIQKKRRVVARVQCRNITNECPEPKCAEPVLLPGRCCKICPGEKNSPDVVQVHPPHLFDAEDEKNFKHFATLMTARTTIPLRTDDPYYTPNNLNNVVATGRFTFHKKSLFYSFYVSDKAARPRLLQFTDSEGNILREQVLSAPGGVVNSLYQNATGKICGVWRRVARDYRRILRDDRMFVTLLWGAKEQQELALSGRIARYPTLSTELFSSLLEPAPDTDTKLMHGAGATAIVSISSTLTPVIRVTLVFNGVFAPDDVADVPINITLMLAKKQQIIMQETKRIAKPSSELNVLEINSIISASDLRLLTRGKLVISVTNKLRPDDLRLTGSVITRTTCELFQTQLTSAISDTASTPHTTGLAWVYLNREGSLVYHVQVDDLTLENNSLITLVDVSGKRKMELEDLTPSLRSGWANGTLEKLAPRVLEPLYAGKIEVNVATQDVDSVIRGRLIAKPVADARDSSAPLLMKRVDSSIPQNVVGMAWFAIDIDCNMHYEVQFSGIEDKNKWYNLYLEQIPFIAPGAPVTKRLLEEDFKGNQVEGFVLNVPQAELARIDSGVSYLILREENDRVLLNATLKQVKVPYNCLPLYSDSNNDVSALINMDSADGVQQPQKCYHESQFYELGAQWTSKHDPCTMCHCHLGKVKCDTYKCPALHCPVNMVKKNEPGVCCPICANSTEENNFDTKQGCNLANKYYPPGSSWNPYIPPMGFDYCVTCTCEEGNYRVNCQRQSCPPLNCHESEAIRLNETSCCKVCPETKSHNHPPPSEPQIDKFQRDEGMKVNMVAKKNRAEILAAGGCIVRNDVYENGEEWHPNLYVGKAPCIFCRCKDKKSSCERKRCPRSLCRQNRSIDIFKYSEPLDECCAQICSKRNRRHHGHRSRNFNHS